MRDAFTHLRARLAPSAVNLAQLAAAIVVGIAIGKASHLVMSDDVGRAWSPTARGAAGSRAEPGAPFEAEPTRGAPRLPEQVGSRTTSGALVACGPGAAAPARVCSGGNGSCAPAPEVPAPGVPPRAPHAHSSAARAVSSAPVTPRLAQHRATLASATPASEGPSCEAQLPAALPPAALPPAALPSAALPSAALPAVSLPLACATPLDRSLTAFAARGAAGAYAGARGAGPSPAAAADGRALPLPFEGDAQAAAPADDWLGEQLAILARAERNLRDGDTAEAVRSLDEYQSRFPDGLLGPQMGSVRQRTEERVSAFILP